MPNYICNLNNDIFIKSNAFEKNEIILNHVINLVTNRSNIEKTKLYLDGHKSFSNGETESIESMARVMPFLASFIYSNYFDESDERYKFIITTLKKSLYNAANKDSAGFWGYPEDYDQLIVEMSDYALTLWMVKDVIWSGYSESERKTILNWMKSIKGRKHVDNNWHLFPVMVEEVLATFEYKYSVEYSKIERIKSFLNSEGWFRDGDNGDYDYYNAWGFYYSFHWLSEINPRKYEEFYKSNLNKFSRQYKYLIGLNGFPFIGRSVCYKYAVSIPLIIAAIKGVGEITHGQALKAYNVIWNNYSKYEVNKNNLLSQGLFGRQPELLDKYSGPGSALWSLRSSVILVSNFKKFIREKEEALPIEISDYKLTINEGEFEIKGCNHTGEVFLIKNTIEGNSFKPEFYTNKNLILEFVLQRSSRPENMKVYNNINKIQSSNPLLKFGRYYDIKR